MGEADRPLPDDATLEERAARLGEVLQALGLRLAVAESCTGGWIAKVLTDVAGSSAWFDAGFVTYSDDAKITMLDVSPETLDAHGAVSEPVVLEMAAGARRVSGAGAAIAISGIAGPGGGSADKPVGLVCFAWSVGDREWSRTTRLAGDREAVRRRSVELAIVSLLRALAN